MPASYRPLQAQVPPPVVAALHHAGAGEPGVILVSPAGEVRFWENTSQALSNVDRYHTAQLELGPDDHADRIWPVDVSRSLLPAEPSR
jgi:nuclear pore complex protein Nup133